MTDGPPTEGHETQEGRPSGVDPMEARDRLALNWWIAPIAVVLVCLVVFGLKLIL
jgi:hypothetical protein